MFADMFDTSDDPYQANSSALSTQTDTDWFNGIINSLSKGATTIATTVKTLRDVNTNANTPANTQSKANLAPSPTSVVSVGISKNDIIFYFAISVGIYFLIRMIKR